MESELENLKSSSEEKEKGLRASITSLESELSSLQVAKEQEIHLASQKVVRISFFWFVLFFSVWFLRVLWLLKSF